MAKTLKQRKGTPSYGMGLVGEKFDPFIDGGNPDELHRRRYSHMEDYSIQTGNDRVRVAPPGEYDDQENNYSETEKAEAGLTFRRKL